MFKFTIGEDGVVVPSRTANKKENLQPVSVEDAAIIEQFPLSEQDINQNKTGEGPSGGENG